MVAKKLERNQLIYFLRLTKKYKYYKFLLHLLSDRYGWQQKSRKKVKTNKLLKNLSPAPLGMMINWTLWRWVWDELAVHYLGRTGAQEKKRTHCSYLSRDKQKQLMQKQYPPPDGAWAPSLDWIAESKMRKWLRANNPLANDAECRALDRNEPLRDAEPIESRGGFCFAGTQDNASHTGWMMFNPNPYCSKAGSTSFPLPWWWYLFHGFFVTLSATCFEVAYSSSELRAMRRAIKDQQQKGGDGRMSENENRTHLG